MRFAWSPLEGSASKSGTSFSSFGGGLAGSSRPSHALTPRICPESAGRLAMPASIAPSISSKVERAALRAAPSGRSGRKAHRSAAASVREDRV